MASNTASHERMTVGTHCGATLDERAQFCTACSHALPHIDAGSGSPDGAALLEADVKALQDRVYRLETRLAAAGIPEVVPVRPFRAGVTSVPAAAATGIAPAPE
ncbi:MAG: hypothetical protein M3Y37_06910, partial [Chloroflexota bacterium]|nr:hypothetical protein [Chloroflexota bacterium]